MTISISGGYPELGPAYQQAANQYHQLHPNVTINVLPAPDLRSYEQKLTTCLPTKTCSDIVVRTIGILAPFIGQGLVAAPPAWMQSFIKSGAFDSFTVGGSSYKGQVWGAPIYVDQNALYYNKDMFAAADLQPPTTMAEIIADASKLAKQDANGNVTTSGLSLRLSGQGSGVAEKFWIWLMQYGTPQAPLGILGETADGKYHATYDNAAGAQVLEMYVNMINKQPLVDDTKIASDTAAFEQGKTAMFVREAYVIADIATNAPKLNYGTVPMPDTSLHTTEVMFVAASSEHQQTAWDFIRFLEALPQQTSVATMSSHRPPARVDLDYSALIQQQPAWAAFLPPKPASYTAQYQGDYPLPEWNEIETKLADHLVSAFTNKSLVDNPSGALSLLQQFANETNSILKQHNDYGQ